MLKQYKLLGKGKELPASNCWDSCPSCPSIPACTVQPERNWSCICAGKERVNVRMGTAARKTAGLFHLTATPIQRVQRLHLVQKLLSKVVAPSAFVNVRRRHCSWKLIITLQPRCLICSTNYTATGKSDHRSDWTATWPNIERYQLTFNQMQLHPLSGITKESVRMQSQGRKREVDQF